MPGCVEPEAFSTSGEHLYVLDYLPPERADRYRVRMARWRWRRASGRVLARVPVSGLVRLGHVTAAS
jgi:hypothetical protein